MMPRQWFVSLLILTLASLPGAAEALAQVDIPEAEITLIRAIGFIEGPRFIARACTRANPSSAAGWDREVAEFEQRRAGEAALARKLFSETYSKAVPEQEALAILGAKVDDRIEQEAAAKHLGAGTLCLVVALVGGKRAFETKGFEETMLSLEHFEQTGEYARLKARIAAATPSEKAQYRERLLAYQPKPVNNLK